MGEYYTIANRSSSQLGSPDALMLQASQRPLSISDSPKTIVGYEGTPQTVRAMIKAAKGPRGERNMGVRRVAESITNGLREKDYTSEIAATYFWVSANKRYAHDPKHVELIKDPLSSLQEIKRVGRASLDCDDLATIMA